jgi:1-acyl-sn-glycerol-3-phosphate acyltransferase
MTACNWTRSRLASVARAVIQDGVLVPALRACWTLRADAPRDLQGPLLIVANHASHLDTPAILAALPPRIRHRTAVAAAADYFYRSPVMGAAASLGIGTFAFARHGRDGCAQAAELLASGWNVLIFPQGSRGADATWQPFRAGVGHVLASTGVGALPLAVRGTRALWPRGHRFPHRGPIDIRFGQVWRPAPDLGPADIVLELETQVKELLK